MELVGTTAGSSLRSSGDTSLKNIIRAFGISVVAWTTHALRVTPINDTRLNIDHGHIALPYRSSERKVLVVIASREHNTRPNIFLHSNKLLTLRTFTVI